VIADDAQLRVEKLKLLREHLIEVIEATLAGFAEDTGINATAPQRSREHVLSRGGDAAAMEVEDAIETRQNTKL
jgi:hypothetical protein